MAKTTLRNLIFQAHKWLGLHMAFFFILMFITGTILLFTDELEALFHPNIWASTPPPGESASFGDIYNSITANFPHSQLFVMEDQPQPWIADRSYVTTAWGESIVVWTDPETAAIRDVTQAENFRFFLRDLHDSLLVPRRIAFVLVSSTSIILLGLLLAGLVTYRRFWKGLLRWPSKQTNGRNRQGAIHRFFAVWSAVFLLITAITGIFFMVTGLGIDGFVPAPNAASARVQTIPQNLDGARLDQATAVARSTGLVPTSLGLPYDPSQGIRFSGHVADHSHLKGGTSVTIDPADLSILGDIGPDEFQGLARWMPLIHALHFGQWGGTASRLIWILFGVLAIYLATSGLKVAAHRTRVQEQSSVQGIISQSIRGLGLFKWAYLALLLGILAIGYVRLGPPSNNWTTIQPNTNIHAGFDMQVFGNLRAGKPLKYRVLNVDDAIINISILPDNGATTPTFSPAELAAPIEFTIVSKATENRFNIHILKQDQTSMTLTYDLGGAIW